MDKLAFIMAAGEGTRMLSEQPKMLHDVCGIPMVEHVLTAIDSVCKEKILIVGHGKERMIEALKGRAQFAEQTKDGWGTGHAVRCAAESLKGRKGTVLVTAGDMPLVLPETFAALINEVEKGAAAAMLTDIVENPVGYGRVVRENGKVAAIVEQKDLVGEQHKIHEMNASVYCFDIEALLWALPQLTANNNAHEYYLTDVISILHRGGYMVTTVPVLEKAECMGINDRVQLAAAETEMRRRINTRHMRAGVTMIDPSRVYIQPDVMIGRDTIIHPGCEIGRGCKIGEKCVLRANCQIAFSSVGDGAKLGNSLIKNASVGAGARLEHAVVMNASVPDGAVIRPFTVIDEHTK